MPAAMKLKINIMYVWNHAAQSTKNKVCKIFFRMCDHCYPVKHKDFINISCQNLTALFAAHILCIVRTII